MDELHRMGNFNGTFLVLIGIQNSSIGTAKKISHDTRLRDIYENIEFICSAKSDFKRYREALRKSSFPCIPYLQLWVKDIEFLIESEPPFVMGKSINFDKCIQFARFVDELRGYQKRYIKIEAISCLQKWIDGLAEEVKYTSKFRKSKVDRQFEQTSEHMIDRFQSNITKYVTQMTPNLQNEIQVCITFLFMIIFYFIIRILTLHYYHHYSYFFFIII
jgi:hypothetical protein